MKLNRSFQVLALVNLCLVSGTASAVINGQDVEHSDADISAPLVALQMSETQPDGSTRFYKGTAFLIGRDLALTAGHNVAYIPDAGDVEVVFASAPCWGPNICKEKRIKAIKTVVHPLFRQLADGTEYDLAIVKLATNAPSDYQPIPLIDRPAVTDVDPIRVLGFGTDRESPEVPLSAFRLRSIGLKLVDPKYRLGSQQKFWLNQSDGGICGGDSGGPAVRGDSVLAVIGLAIHVTYSNGVGHCLTQAAFTDLLFFRNWIAATIARLSIEVKDQD